MTVTRAITDVFNGVATSGNIIAPTRNLGTGDGTPTDISSSTWSNGGIWGVDNTTTSYSGFRMVTGGIDLSTRTLVGWQSTSDSSSKQNLDTFANAGMRIVFDDGTNWAAYTMFGGNIAPFLSSQDGSWANFTGLAANDQSTTPSWFLDRANRTTYASSGTLDWANISHIEMHFKPSSSTRIQFVFGRFITADLSVFTGTASTSLFSDMRGGHTNPGGGYYIYPWLFRPALLYCLSAFQSTETMQIGVQIGDGSTTTTLSESNFSLSFWGRAEDYDSSTAVPPNTVILIDTPRLIDIYQSAADSVTFTDFLYSSTSTIGWRVRGDTGGTATATRGTMTNLDQAELAHGTYTDCIWQDCTVPIEIDANTALTGGTIRDSYGMEITSAAADYSAITCNFADNNVSDIKVGEGGAGTYTLSGVTTSGTLYVWNSSTTNSVTVTLAQGVTNESIDLWFNYDNEASGPFTEGEDLTFGNGATATLHRLVDNGTTGTMYCELLTGSAPPDNNSITGDTSSATANVNEASGANSSTLTISQVADTFTINSSEDSSTIRIFTTGTQTLLDSTTGSSLAFTHTGQTVDYTVQKAGFTPQRFTSITLSGTSSTTVNLKVSREYNAAHSLTYTTDASWDRGLNQLTVPTYGVTGRNVFSLMLDSFISQTSLYNTAFNLEMDGDGQLYLINDAECDADSSVTNLTRCGVTYISTASANTAIWAGFNSVGTMTGFTAEFQQQAGTGTTDARASGVVDELVKVFGDATHGNFDYRTHFVWKAQPNGYYESRADIPSVSGEATLSGKLYIFALELQSIIGFTTGDPAISVTLVDHTAAPITVGGESFSWELQDNSTASNEDMQRDLNFYKSGDATNTDYLSLNPFNLPDWIRAAGSTYTTENFYVEGETGLQGLWVSRSAADHPGFTSFTADNGNVYTPVDVVSWDWASGLDNTRVRLYNVTASTSSSWAASTAYSVGDRRLRASGLGTELGGGVFMYCSTAGTSGASEPTWDVAADGNTTNDGTAVWTTRAVERDNSAISGGGGYSYTLTPNTDFTSGDQLTMLGTYQQSAVAKLVFRSSSTVTTADIVVSDSQVDWEFHNTVGIDGDPTNVTECSTNYSQIQVEVNDADNSTTKARIAAFIVDALTTEEGIRQWVGLDGTPVIDYVNAGSAIIDTDVANVKIDNIKNAPLDIVDTFKLRASSGISLVNDSTYTVNFDNSAEAVVVPTGSAVLPSDVDDIVNGVHNSITEGTETFKETSRLMRAAIVGKSAVSGSTVTFRDLADSKDRITATTDSNGQRTAVTTNAS